MTRSVLATLAACLATFSTLPQLSFGLGKTDTITWGGDSTRSGYETTHNLDPRIVASSDFGNIWTAKLPGNFNNIGQEQVLSQPLVYTTNDGVQYVFVATTQNNLYKINAKTGDIVKTRNLGVPFLAADLGNCNDISPAIGVSGTGVIDPATGYWYLTSKTYSDQFQNTLFGPSNSPGRQNGRYYFHAINTEDLSSAPNFPRALEGTIFRNNPNRMLISGQQHQRPALLQVGQFIYTGWASHCIQYNYTGAIIGFDKTTGAVVEAFATQGGGEPNTVPGGGVWMSGGGLAYDGAGSMFFSTGNGYAGQLPANGHPVQGRNVPTALEEAVVNMKLHDDGTIEPVDFFMPWEKTQLDGADKDLGTTPFQLLPSSFSCPQHRRIGLVTGKSGKTYWLNVDSLGGYQQGANRLDDAIQVYQHENSVYSAAGVLPLGGYIYVNVINYKTRAFQFSCDANGKAVFTEAGTALEKNAQALGVGHGTTTSLNGQAGTGLYWTTDVDGMDLRIYDPVPSSDGVLKLVRGFNIPGPGKFAHPVFGDGRAYVGARGALYAYGAPVNLPLNCTSPIQFPKTSLNSTSAALQINCTANVQTTVTGFNISGNPNFVTEGLPTTPLTLAPGGKFNFKARFAPKQVGSLSSDVIISTQNAAAGSSSSTPVTLAGTSNSAAALFSINPITVSFNTTIGAGKITKSVFFNNEGDTSLNVTSVQFSTVSETGPWVTPNTTADGLQVAQFTFSNIPSSVPANNRTVVGITYNPPEAGNHAVFVKATTSGGSKLLDVFGATGSAPGAFYEFERADGSGWDAYAPGKNFTFGVVAPGSIKNLRVRITNNGSSTASPLGLTVSKPPFGVPGFVRAANSIDLAEGTQIAAGQSATAVMYCSPPEAQVNTPSSSALAGWRINTNTDQGAVILAFDCSAVSPQVGPLFSNGTAVNGYIGCYQDETPGRQLATNPFNNDSLTSADCLNTCAQGGYIYTGTIYRRECWCGNALPLNRGTELDCNYRCGGDDQHSCGGDGEQHNQHMISLFADSTKWDGVLQGPALSMTQNSGNYSYAGCYAESNNVKSFNAKRQVSNVQTVDSCRKYCAGYNLFGLQYASECYCGSTIAGTSKLTVDSDCSYTCKGNNSQFCGGSQRMQVYQLGGPPSSSTTTGTATSSPTAAPTEVDGVSPTIGAYTYQGCYSDFQPDRVLTKSAQFDDANNTNRVCAAFCAGSAYFGTEYGRECYCGDSLDSRSTLQTDGRCSMPCTGNSTEVCGGMSGLSLFKLSSNGTSSSSTVTTTATSTSSSTASTSTITTTTAASTPTAAPLKCPDSNNTTYVSNGKTFLIECGKDYPGNDLKTVNVNTNDLNACINACATTTGCVNVALSGAACYLKKALAANPTSNGVWGARLLTNTTSSTSTTSTSTSSSSSVSSTLITTTTTASSSSTTLTSTSTSTSSSTTLTSTSTSTSSTSSTSSTTSTPTPLICPDSNNTTYVSNGKTFLVECGKDYQGNDLKTVGVQDNNLNQCIDACATTSGCAVVALSGAACYLKSAVSDNPAINNVWGARLLNSTSTSTSSTQSPTSTSASSTTSSSTTTSISTTATSSTSATSSSSSPSSTPTTLTTSTSTSTSSSTSTTSSKTSTTTTAAPTVQAKADIYNNLGSYGELGNNQRALANETYTNTTMTPSLCATEAKRRSYAFFGVEYGKECWMADALNSTSKQLTQTSCTTLCPGDNTTFCGGSASLQVYKVNATLVQPKAKSPSPLSCPAADDTVFTGSNGGKFRIECGWDRTGASNKTVAANTYEDCLTACINQPDCKSISLNGKNCYLKTILGTAVRNDKVRGATLLPMNSTALPSS